MAPVERDLASVAVGEPEDIAGAVASLADPATSFVTGTVITVDGGQTAMLAMPGAVAVG